MGFNSGFKGLIVFPELFRETVPFPSICCVYPHLHTFIFSQAIFNWTL